jgi:outer membrane immunogenic protein
MRSVFLPCVVASVVLAQPDARAADIAPARKVPAYAAPVASALPDWTGFYVGAQAGYGFGHSSGTQNAGGTFFPVVPYTIDPHGFLGGGHLGVNYQLGMVVLGVEGDVEAADVTGMSSLAAFGQSYFFNVKTDMLASLRGRAGVAFDRWLVYGTGGVAWGHVTTPPLSALDGTRTGWTAGAGVEYAFNTNWSASLEYRYTDLGRVSAAGGEPTAVDDNSLAFHAIRVGLSYRFAKPRF